MSLVGPRPLPVTYVRRYTPAEHRRHAVRPGLTGWAQVNGRNELGWDERLALDVWYVEHRSLCARPADPRCAPWSALVRRNGISAPGEATMAELRPPAAHAPALRPSRRPPCRPKPPRRRRAASGCRRPTCGRRSGRLLLAALDSGWVAPVGPDLDAFEAELAERCGVPHAVALSSGTAALHLALLQVGVGPGDDVLVPTVTFAATANAVTYCGARPCFIDTDPVTWQMSPGAAGRRAGRAAPARAEPCRPPSSPSTSTAPAPTTTPSSPSAPSTASRWSRTPPRRSGATFGGRPAGSFGAAGVLSFNGNKIITTSCGGALLCHDRGAADRARYLATQARQPGGPLRAHRGRLQLPAVQPAGRLRAGPARHARRADRPAPGHPGPYREALADLAGVAFPAVDLRGTTNAWLTCITLEPGVGRAPARRAAARARGRRTSRPGPLWKPMHAQPVFAANPARLDGTADRLFATGLCLPSGSGMTDDDLDRVVDALRDALAKRGRAAAPSRREVPVGR